MKGPMDFTYKEYSRFIRHARKVASIFALEDWEGQNGIILRHDVDFDIGAARRLSKVERKLGVRSTYFVMASNRYYNPLFPDNQGMLRAMVSDGFEIGLHFDPSIYGDITKKELGKRVKLECDILETASGKPIRSVSLHNPSLSGMYPLFKGYKNAYSKEIFSDENYMSDSCMGFRGKDPYEFVKRAAKMPIQLVFHPMHWSEEGRDYVGYFADYVTCLADHIDDTMRVNAGYKRDIGKRRLRNVVGRSLNGRDKD